MHAAGAPARRSLRWAHGGVFHAGREPSPSRRDSLCGTAILWTRSCGRIASHRARRGDTEEIRTMPLLPDIPDRLSALFSRIRG
jgi:hypothetical protein